MFVDQFKWFSHPTWCSPYFDLSNPFSNMRCYYYHYHLAREDNEGLRSKVTQPEPHTWQQSQAELKQCRDLTACWRRCVASLKSLTSPGHGTWTSWHALVRFWQLKALEIFLLHVNILFEGTKYMWNDGRKMSYLIWFSTFCSLFKKQSNGPPWAYTRNELPSGFQKTKFFPKKMF